MQTTVLIHAARRLSPVLKLVLALLMIVAVFDAAIFRSGLYSQMAEPASLAGATNRALRLVGATYESGRRNVLVLGNSKVGEALSTERADAAVDGTGLHFVNGFVPGSDPRVWYYLLRELDPHFDRYTAIALAVPYDPKEVLSQMADWAIDISYLSPLIRWSDLGSFPAGFDAPSLQRQAARAILFPGQAARSDVAAFIAAPVTRYEALLAFRRDYVRNFAAYQGRPNAEVDLEFDLGSEQPKNWDKVDPALRGYMAQYFRSLHQAPAPDVLASNERYYGHWLSKIAEPYRARGIPVILFPIPRSPWNGTQTPAPALGGSIAAVVDAGLAQALPGDAFFDLERPRYFFDLEHMNKLGRDAFTPRFAKLVAERVH